MDITLLAQYGVELENVTKPETMLTLVKIYNDLVTSLNTEKESAKSQVEASPAKTSFIESVENNTEIQELVKQLESQLRSAIAETMEQNPLSAIVLSSVVNNLAKDMTGEKNYQIAMALKDVQDETPDLPEDWESKKEEAGNVGELIRNLFTTFQAVFMQDKDFVKSFPLKDKTENGKVTGKIPDLTKLPRSIGTEEDSAPVGKAAANSRVNFNWNGKDLGNIMLNELLHDHISDFTSGYVVTWSVFREAVEKVSGNKSYAQAAVAGTEVEFKTGKLVMSVTK